MAAGDIDAFVSLGRAYYDGEESNENRFKAFELYKKALVLDPENPKALAYLTNSYNYSVGVEMDQAKALDLYCKAAERGNKDLGELVKWLEVASNDGHSDASMCLGLYYKFGHGGPKDSEKALQYFERAQAQGSIVALIELGYAHDDNGIATPDYEKAANYYAAAYAAGSVQGAFCLATMYETGNGVPKDMTKALDLYTYASENGHSSATVRVGIFYYDGLGTKQDVARSVEYFEKAKAMGNPEADELLDLVYTRNIVEGGIDSKKAFEFYMKQANEGDADAQYMIYQAYATGEGIDENRGTALIWLRKAADNGHTISQGLMGANEIILGNIVSAVEYLEKASAKGFRLAMHLLAEIYLDGAQGVPMNKTKAIELLRESADEGYAESQSSLGLCYATGNGVEQDDYEAVRWFTMAAEQGEPNAQKNLGLFYRSGRGVQLNKVIAAEWFRKAAAQGNVQAKACLADMLMEDDGVTSNNSKAESLYREVMTNGESGYQDSAIQSFAHMYVTRALENYSALQLRKHSTECGNISVKYDSVPLSDALKFEFGEFDKKPRFF